MALITDTAQEAPAEAVEAPPAPPTRKELEAESAAVRRELRDLNQEYHDLVTDRRDLARLAEVEARKRELDNRLTFIGAAMLRADRREAAERQAAAPPPEPEPDPLEAKYRQALLDAHDGRHGAQARVAKLEADMLTAQLSQRRQEALEAALAQRRAEAEKKAQAELEEERRAVLVVKQGQLDDAMAALVEAGKKWVAAAGLVLELAAEVRNESLHGYIADQLRAQCLALPPPWNRRLPPALGPWPSEAARNRMAP